MIDEYLDDPTEALLLTMSSRHKKVWALGILRRPTDRHRTSGRLLHALAVGADYFSDEDWDDLNAHLDKRQATA